MAPSSERESILVVNYGATTHANLRAATSLASRQAAGSGAAAAARRKLGANNGNLSGVSKSNEDISINIRLRDAAEARETTGGPREAREAAARSGARSAGGCERESPLPSPERGRLARRTREAGHLSAYSAPGSLSWSADNKSSSQVKMNEASKLAAPERPGGGGGGLSSSGGGAVARASPSELEGGASGQRSGKAAACRLAAGGRADTLDSAAAGPSAFEWASAKWARPAGQESISQAAAARARQQQQQQPQQQQQQQQHHQQQQPRGQQRKQLFNLRQLAISSTKNLARKGASLAKSGEQAANKQQQRRHLSSGAHASQDWARSSSSESSVGSIAGHLGEPTQRARPSSRQIGDQMPPPQPAGGGAEAHCSAASQKAEGGQSQLEPGETEEGAEGDNERDLDDDDEDHDEEEEEQENEDENERADGEDDDDNDDLDDDDDDDDDQDEDEEDEQDEEDGDEEEESEFGLAHGGSRLGASGRRRTSIEDQADNGRRSGDKLARRRRQVGRRPSCCNCERLVARIDFDGQPVTDVDLVTYKDLCQIEQQAHQLRTSHRRHYLEPAAAVRAYSVLGAKPARRSSLQEESGAYYQLCTSSEEQAIRRKYVWFPPSLKQLALVDQFFASFPREKVPFAQAAARLAATATAPPAGKRTEGGVSGREGAAPGRAGQVGAAEGGPQAPAAALASSYRDEQISFQLPRQDISLDYCSYPMSDSGRVAYAQFVDKRNTQALDVASVVQMRLNFSGAEAAASQASQASTSKHHSGPQACQRKASTASQSALASMLSFSQSQQERLLAGQQATGAGAGAQRCRRCLTRFEDKQLAVMAPNFIIGSAVYRPGSIAAPGTDQPAPWHGPVWAKQQQGRQLQQQLYHHLQGTEFTPTEALQQVPVPPSNVALFHATCFTCSTCKEFLVDLVYCLRDNKLYCLRHYGESLRPRCSWCQELIFSDEYLKAMNESFHVDHFLCRHCDSNLAGQRYVLKDEKPFCIQCYEANFANVCEDCEKPIGIDSRDLSYKDRHWHDTCFLCNKCQQSLIDKPFGSKADKVYCADCYDVTFATRCDACKNPFRAGSKKMEYRGRQWHDSCFCCCVCQNTIGSNSFIPKNDEIYCIKCYEDKYATKCTKCKQVIISGGITFRNEPWHRDCFNCCNCNKSLAGQRFTTRDVKNETVKDTNRTNQPHNAYCIDCYGDLFAKKCYACSQAITGLGGTRFVTFEDRSWHNDCFICNDCNTSLVGKGFITDGPEAILCGECARAKLR